MKVSLSSFISTLQDSISRDTSEIIEISKGVAVVASVSLASIGVIYCLDRENLALQRVKSRVHRACRAYETGQYVKSRKFLGDVLKDDRLKSCSEEYIRAQFLFAIMCNCGEGGEKNQVTARFYFGEIIKDPPEDLSSLSGQAYLASLVNHANMLRKGEGGDVDVAGAREGYLRVASYSLDEIPESTKGIYVASLITLIQMLKDGKGGEVDLSGAKECFDKISDCSREDITEGLQAAMDELRIALRGEGEGSFRIDSGISTQ
ncbi:MAG: hypothetical protein L7U87_06195 [Chlamydiales bacterium]|nr:hypothetical protein [Chlamydiales bacterium]